MLRRQAGARQAQASRCRAFRSCVRHMPKLQSRLKLLVMYSWPWGRSDCGLVVYVRACSTIRKEEQENNKKTLLKHVYYYRVKPVWIISFHMYKATTYLKRPHFHAPKVYNSDCTVLGNHLRNATGDQLFLAPVARSGHSLSLVTTSMKTRSHDTIFPPNQPSQQCFVYTNPLLFVQQHYDICSSAGQKVN